MDAKKQNHWISLFREIAKFMRPVLELCGPLDCSNNGNFTPKQCFRPVAHLDGSRVKRLARRWNFYVPSSKPKSRITRTPLTRVSVEATVLTKRIFMHAFRYYNSIKGTVRTHRRWASERLLAFEYKRSHPPSIDRAFNRQQSSSSPYKNHAKVESRAVIEFPKPSSVCDTTNFVS